jgi:hypothetical protein
MNSKLKKKRKEGSYFLSENVYLLAEALQQRVKNENRLMLSKLRIIYSIIDIS